MQLFAGSTARSRLINMSVVMNLPPPPPPPSPPFDNDNNQMESEKEAVRVAAAQQVADGYKQAAEEHF